MKLAAVSEPVRVVPEPLAFVSLQDLEIGAEEIRGKRFRHGTGVKLTDSCFRNSSNESKLMNSFPADTQHTLVPRLSLKA